MENIGNDQQDLVAKYNKLKLELVEVNRCVSRQAGMRDALESQVQAIYKKYGVSSKEELEVLVRENRVRAEELLLKASEYVEVTGQKIMELDTILNSSQPGGTLCS